MKSGGRSNLADIDLFRGVAAFVVAAMHTRNVTWVGIREYWAINGTNATPESLVSYLTFPLVWGSMGVPIFFVISGFCIHRGQAVTRARSGAFQLPAGNFLIRRFFRIYPVIAGALLLTLLCDSLSRQYYPNSVKLGDTGVTAFLLNLFSLQGVAGSTYGSNSPLWTLSIEVHFYLLYPVLLLAMGRLGSLGTLLAMVVVNAISYFVFQLQGYMVFPSFYTSWYLGALVAEAESDRTMSERLASPGLRAGMYALALAGMGIGCLVFFRNNFIAFQIWAVAFAVFLFAVITRRRAIRGPLARMFRWMGTFSFSLYIVHMPVAVLIHSMTFHSVRQASIWPFILTLVAVIGTAYVFFWIFERPALAWSRRFKARSAPVISS